MQRWIGSGFLLTAEKFGRNAEGRKRIGMMTVSQLEGRSTSPICTSG